MTRTNALALAASRGFLLGEDVETIQRCVRILLPQIDHPLRVFDLGAGSGTTALAVLDEAENAQITTVDNDQTNLQWAEKAVRNCYPDADWIGIIADAAETFGREPETVDLLLHDAGHERDDVDRDLRAWLPLLAPHALIWVHDAKPPPSAWGQPPSPGVMQAIMALVGEGLIRGVGNADGLGWIGKRA